MRNGIFTSNGNPFREACESGLFLDPQIGCGAARTNKEGVLTFDPTLPIVTVMRELTEQADIWRRRKSLHIVRAEVTHARITHDSDDFSDVSPNTSGAGRRQWLRPGSAAPTAAARLSSDEADMRMRLQWKLPLGV